MKYCLALKKNEVLSCYNMGEPQKYDANWKKLDTKGYMLYDSIYMKCPEQFTET